MCASNVVAHQHTHEHADMHPHHATPLRARTRMRTDTLAHVTHALSPAVALRVEQCEEQAKDDLDHLQPCAAALRRGALSARTS